MNELLRALGVELFIDQVCIKLQTYKVMYPAGSTSPQISSSGVWTLGNSYQTSYSYYIPTIYWSFTTEFGQQLANYNASQQQQWGGYLGQLNISNQPGMIIPSTGSSYPGAGLYGGAISNQQIASQQQQQAMQNAQLASQQNQYRLTSSAAVPQGQLIMQSPTSQVVIKNLDTSEEEDKKSWVQKIREYVIGRFS